MTFAKWMDDLDDLCQTDTQMKIHDLPVRQFTSAYELGYTPTQFRLQNQAPVSSALSPSGWN